MRTLFLATYILALPLSLAGCDLGGGAVGCDFREGSLNGPEDRCQERTGLQAATFDAACEASGGVPVDGGCPMDGVVAGCLLNGSGANGDVIDWYYAPETVESVTSSCGSSDEFIEP